MKSISKILEYDGHMHMLCRYCQEMMAYNFDCVHRLNSMMKDVDALSRMFDPLVAEYIQLTNILRIADRKMRYLTHTMKNISMTSYQKVFIV